MDCLPGHLCPRNQPLGLLWVAFDSTQTFLTSACHSGTLKTSHGVIGTLTMIKKRTTVSQLVDGYIDYAQKWTVCVKHYFSQELVHPFLLFLRLRASPIFDLDATCAPRKKRVIRQTEPHWFAHRQKLLKQIFYPAQS